MQLLRDTTDSSTPEGCGHEVLDAVPPVIWFIRRHMRKFRKGLSLAQFRSLVFVRRQPSASLSALSEHLGSSMPTASRIAQGLVAQGLLQRKGCLGDRRQLSLAITERGQEVLNSAWAGTGENLASELQKLTPAQRSAVAEAMGIIKTIFGSMGLGEPTRLTDTDESTAGARLSSETNSTAILQKV
jgi:DNA-binding MarR family transcriptional regulator